MFACWLAHSDIGPLFPFEGEVSARHGAESYATSCTCDVAWSSSVRYCHFSPCFSLSLFLLFVLPLCLALFSSTSLCFLALHPQNITTPPLTPIHRQVGELFCCTLHARGDGSKLAAVSRLVSIIIIANHTIASSNHHDPHPTAIIIIGHSGQLGKKGHCIIDGAKIMPVVLGAIVSTVRLVSSGPVCVCVFTRLP